MALYADRTTNQPVPFHRLRKLWLAAPMQEGVVNVGDLKVTQRAAGANMSVDIATGDFWIRTDIDTPDGLVHGFSDAISNQPVTASHATLPRVDSVYVQYNDSSAGAGVGGDTPTFRVLAGTATTGAQIANFAAANYRAGAAAAPNDAMLLTDILVPAAATSITNTNIVDRRGWARGAFWHGARNTTALTSASATHAAADTANLQARLECSGLPITVTVNAVGSNATAGQAAALGLQIDGSQQGLDLGTFTSATAGAVGPLSFEFYVAPAAGSHVFTLTMRTATSGTSTFNASTNNPLEMFVAEETRPNANNGTS